MKEEKGYSLNNPAKSSPQERKKSPEKILRERQEKKTRNSKRRGVEVVILQAVVSLVFLGMLFTVDVIPLKYTGIVLAVLFVLFVITYLTQRKRKLHLLGKMLGILESIILAIGILVLVILNMTFDSVIDDVEKKNDVAISVTQEVFHVFINDNEKYRLATVNPERQQILLINIPAEYFVAIPGVSEGKRDTLKNAEDYGMEAVMSAIGSLYETEVLFYVNLDFAKLQETLENFTPDKMISPSELTNSIGDNIETNLSKRQVQQLIKLYLGEDEEWKVFSVNADGAGTSNYTYTMPNKASYVINPDRRSIEKIKDLINRMEDGEKLKDSDVDD